MADVTTYLYQINKAPWQADGTVEALAEKYQTTPEGMMQRMAIGTPDVIAARVRTFTDAGLNHVIFAPSLAPRPERFHEQLDMLAREVAPLVTK